jgi:eukaryotic-like serine/threonine-protein kinase
MIGSKINHYLIEEKIGSGGQGTVYKALDTKLNRTVVVKVLSPELTAKTSNFRRFEREAQLCSQLDHPNVCTVFDFDDADGVYYIAMQFIEGKNVRQLVAGKPLEMKSALSIAVQVCDALSYSHSRGIIHRDIKAGNVMVTPSGQAKILDFGLAKLMENPGAGKAGADADITEIGIPYGTATYAAPEQARGERADHRADVFSTGVLVYEMLTGIWAFQGKTVVDVRHQVLHGTPTPISAMRQDRVPVKLQEIVDRALAKEPKDRYQKMSDMRDDLKAVLQEVASSTHLDGQIFAPKHAEEGVVMKAWHWITGKHEDEQQGAPSFPTNTGSMDPSTTVGPGARKSIAILPFTNLGKDPESNFYEFALADAVITELARLKSIIVRPSSIITKYQGVEVDAQEAGQELKVDAILTSGFLRSGQRIRVTAQLIDVASGELLWSDRIDAEGSDVLVLQDRIAQRILSGLRVELSEKEQSKLGRKPTESTEAWEEYLRGRDNFGRFIFRTVANEDCEAAIANFKHAIELDAHFALAYSGLGACYVNRVFKGMGHAEDYTHAENAFTKAFFYDPNLAEARVLMVMIYMARCEKKKAHAEIEVLEKQFPNEAPLYFVKGTISRLDGEYEASLKAWDKLAKLDPAAGVISSYNKSRIYLYQGLFETALDELDKGMAIEPNHPMLRIFRSAVLFYSGDRATALRMIEEVLKQNPKMDGIKPLYAIFLAGSGRTEDARKQLSGEALGLARADHDMAYWVASTYALLGEIDLAFKWLNRAIKLGNENRQWFYNDNNLAVLRTDSRWDETIAKIGEYH